MNQKIKKAAIIGSTDLALHMAQYLSAGGYEIAGLFDDFRKPGTKAGAYTVLGAINDIITHKGRFDEVFIGIGYNHLNKKSEVSEFLISNGIIAGTFVHPAAFAEQSAVIGSGSFILPNCTIDKAAIIGRNIFMNPNCCVSHDSVIGDESFFGPGSVVSGKCKIGKRCFLGAGSVIKDNIEVCDGVLIGAGAVVTKNISEAGIYAGVPAKKISR